MITCPNCGTIVEDEINVCPSCGTILEEDQPEIVPADNVNEVSDAAYEPAQEVLQPYATGGLMAWSIITLFFCTLPGVLALINTTQINKAETVEEQQQKIKTAKIWCAVGTVLGVLLVIGKLAQGGMI